MVLSNKGTLTGVFAAAAAVGTVHYGITACESILASAYVGMHAAWGALAFDVFRTIKSRHDNTNIKGQKPSPGLNS